MQSFQSVPEPTKLNKSTFLLTCSIINIILFPICVGLEIAHPFVYQGIWGSSTFFIAGLVGFSTSYTPKRSLLFATLVFSSISIVFTIVSCILSGFGYFIGYRDCIYVWNSDSYYYDEYVCGGHYYSGTQMILLVAEFLAGINSLIITIWCSLQICNCCKRVDSSIPIVVHNPQQPTPVWIISPTGQQQQLQSSYSTVVYSPPQQQPSMQQEQHQAEYHTTQTDPAAPPPPYSTVDTLEPEQKKENV